MEKRHIEEKHTDPFAEYFISGEPDRADKAYAWQTAVFFIKYIRSLGFHAQNDVFAKNAWYFRNALVRANYSDLGAGIHEDLSYLENFLRNLLMGEKHELKNRYLHIAWIDSSRQDEKQPIKQPFEQPIKNSPAEILKTKPVSSRTRANISRLYDEFENEKVFGRGGRHEGA